MYRVKDADNFLYEVFGSFDEATETADLIGGYVTEEVIRYDARYEWEDGTWEFTEQGFGGSESVETSSRQK